MRLGGGEGRKITMVIAGVTRLKENLQSPGQPDWRHSRSENGKVEEGFNARTSWAHEDQTQYQRDWKAVAS